MYVHWGVFFSGFLRLQPAKQVVGGKKIEERYNYNTTIPLKQSPSLVPLSRLVFFSHYFCYIYILFQKCKYFYFFLIFIFSSNMILI